VSACRYTESVSATHDIPERIREDAPGILAAWRSEVCGGEEPEFHRLQEGMERLLGIFAEFLESDDSVESFSLGGGTHVLVREIAACQHRLERDAVGVIGDFSVLRRAVWRTVGSSIRFEEAGGAEVARFFVKLMDASDWVTQAGLEAFDSIAQEQMEEALGRAARTDLLTGLPDRDYFNRLILPRAIETRERFAVAVFDVANFSETLAEGKVTRARELLLKLTGAVQNAFPEEAVYVRFGDDEVCALIPEEGAEVAYAAAEKVRDEFSEEPEGPGLDIGVAEYPAHARNAEELMQELSKALGMAKRISGSSIVVAR
jgi:GGDEF domain-containing protein